MNGVQDYFFYELAQALMCVMSSQNSLFGQISLVLAFYTKLDKTLQFLALNSLHLKPLVFDTLADLSALLKVIEAVLLGNFGIHANLVPNSLRVGSESVVPLMFELALLVFLLLLLLDDSEELVTLGLRLLGQHDLSFDELSSASDVKIFSLYACELGLFFFLSTCLALTFFKSTLSSQGINLTLTVSCTLLKLSQPLNLEFFLLFDKLRLTRICLLL